MISLSSIAAARVALAEKALLTKDARYFAAYHELGRELLKTETERLIEASRGCAMTSLQAG